MAKDYTVALRITVSGPTPQPSVITEESTFANLTFAQMAHVTSEFYAMVAKLDKEKK